MDVPFGRQDRHSGSHITGLQLLPPTRSILTNPGKTAFLLVLPLVAALDLLHEPYFKCVFLVKFLYF